MADKYYVIAGAVPAFKHTARHVLDKATKKPRLVRMGDVLDEDFFQPGEIAELTKEGFIEMYTPHTITKADLELGTTIRNPVTGVAETVKKNRNLIEALDLKPGMVIHKGTKGFTPAQATEPIKK